MIRKEDPMKKRIAALALALVICFAVTGCGSTGGEGKKETVYLSFPTASTSGTVYAIGASLSNLWNEKCAGIQVSAEASNGGVQNLNLIAGGESQMGVAVTSILTDQRSGQGAFEGRAYDGMRILTALYMNYNQIVVTRSSGIDSIRDIKGKRFAPGAAGSTTTLETEIHFTQAGVRFPDDFSASFVGFTEAVDLMRNRQMDGAWIMAGIPTSAVSELCSTADAKVLSMDEELIAALSARYPWYSRAVIPAGTYAGQEEDVITTGVTITICIDQSVPDDVAYQLAKVMYENIDAVRSIHAALANLSVENAVQNLAGLPIHDGAARYYREVGVLPDK